MIRSICVGVVLIAACVTPARASAQTSAAPTLRVPQQYATIHEAVAAAPSGARILIAPGTYTEEVVLDKDVTLVGAGTGATVISAPTTLTPYGVHLPDSRLLEAIVRVTGPVHAGISGLTVSGPIPCGVEVTGIHALNGATLEVSDSRVTNIRTDANTCPAWNAAGRAIVFGTPPHIEVDGQRGSTAFGSVTRTKVDHYQHAGISIGGPATGPVSHVRLDHDAISGGWQLPSFQVGVWISDGGAADVVDNSIEGNVCGGAFCGPDLINEAQGLGVLVLSVRERTTLIGNRIANNDVGLEAIISPDCCQIADNAFVDNTWFGAAIIDGAGSMQGNYVTGGQVGIAAVASTDDTTVVLRGNRISNTSVRPTAEIDCCGVTARVLVNGTR